MKIQFSRLRRAAVLCSLCLASSAFADNLPAARPFILSWSATTANDDGSPVTDLVGYYIYHGTSPDNMQPQYFSGATKPWVLLSYPAGSTHYFAIAAVNADGVESTLSPVVNCSMY
jgi:hypothetical protein